MKRSWRAVPVVFTLLILLSLVALAPLWNLGRVPATFVRWAVGFLWALAGLWAYRLLQRTVVRRLQGGLSVAAQVALLGGVTLLVLVILWVLGFSPSGIAIGGALTGVVLGLAAQTTLANVFGGFALMATRPYLPGDHVTLRAAAFSGGEYSGVVRSLNFFYTVLADGPRRIAVPNATAAVAAITVHPSARVRFDVTLSQGCDLEDARLRLLRVAPDAEARIMTVTSAGTVVSLDLPANFSWRALGRWLAGPSGPPPAEPGRGPDVAPTPR